LPEPGERRAAPSDEGTAVSMIVPTFRDWDRLALCVASLAAQNYRRDLLDIVVVNNDPDEGPPASLALPPNARLVSEGRKGSYAARNAGLALARGDIVLFTDSDCVADPGWVAAAVDHLLSHPEIARIGGRIAIAQSEDGPTVADVYEAAFAFPQEKYVAQGWAPTANMAARRQVFEAIGPFEDAHYSGGDREWGERAERAGHRIGYAPEAIVTHPPRTLAEILTKRRRIAGAILNRRIAVRGRAALVPGYVLKALKRLLPPTRPIGQLLRLKAFPARLRWRAYLFIWYMRLDTEVARGRILLFGAEPERR
jgi:GT2 family glycosyltransferase